VSRFTAGRSARVGGRWSRLLLPSRRRAHRKRGTKQGSRLRKDLSAYWVACWPGPDARPGAHTRSVRTTRGSITTRTVSWTTLHVKFRPRDRWRSFQSRGVRRPRVRVGPPQLWPNAMIR